MQSHTDSTKQSHKGSGIKRLAVLAMLAALSFGIYALESLIPNPIPIPGIKLGLSNVIVLVVLKRFGLRDSALVLTVRLLLSMLLFGTPMSLLYSAAGGILCLLGEAALNRFLQGHALFITAALGALLHNAGQLAVAILITSSLSVIVYAPYLAIAAIITGFLTGLCAYFLLKKLPEELLHKPH